MLGNTMNLAVNGQSLTLSRLDGDAKQGSTYLYKDSDQRVMVRVRQSESGKVAQKRYRRNVLVERIVFATPTVNESYTTVSLTISDHDGAVDDRTVELVSGLMALSPTFVSDVVSGEY